MMVAWTRMVVVEGVRSDQILDIILYMNMKPTGLSNGLNLGDGESQICRMIPRFWPEQLYGDIISPFPLT